jgi:alginate O-acetyltransferase complex protein AlgJ
VVHGHASSAFESTYRRAALYRDDAVGLFGAVRYDLFGEGRHGVVVGNDGWLFTAEEFETAANADARSRSLSKMSTGGSQVPECLG